MDLTPCSKRVESSVDLSLHCRFVPDTSIYSDIYPTRNSNTYAEVGDLSPEPSYATPREDQGHPQVQGHMPSANGGYLQAVPRNQPILNFNQPFAGFYSNQGDYEMSRMPSTDGGYIGDVGIHNDQPPPYEKLDNNQPIGARHTIYEEKNDAVNNAQGKTYEKLADNQPIEAMDSNQIVEARNTIYEESNNDENDENAATGKAYEKLANYQPKESSNSVYAERKAYDNSAFENGHEEKNVNENDNRAFENRSQEKNVDEKYLEEQTEK